METVVAVAVIVVAIIAGVVLIHRLNLQHGERITAFHYSDVLPGVGRRHRRRRGEHGGEQ
ncbi:hypothetical protein OG607_21010 [Streptomyces sp. NBC_01537]|uniref:hypothetical protein n=1 Tax=Streptomyces sp. NBC_01537 TaxID=2903896 RepID=UPI00386F60E9